LTKVGAVGRSGVGAGSVGKSGSKGEEETIDKYFYPGSLAVSPGEGFAGQVGRLGNPGKIKEGKHAGEQP
jgi:hypothetical protein